MVKIGVLLKPIRKLLLTICIVLIMSLSLFVGGASFLLSDKGNEWIRQHLQSYLSKKLRTDVTIGRLHTQGIESLTLINFRLPDQHGKELLFFKTLSVEAQWRFLFTGDRSILKIVNLDQLQATIERKQSDFNYQFVLDAFAGENASNKRNTSEIDWLIPGQVELTRFMLNYVDEKQGEKTVINILTLRSNLDIVDEIIPAKWVAKDILLDSAIIEISSALNKLPEKVTEKQDNSIWPGLLEISGLEVRRSEFRLDNEGESFSVNSRVGRALLKKGYYSGLEHKISAGMIGLDDHITSIKIKQDGQGHESLSDSNTEPFTFSVDTLLINRNRISLNFTDRKKFNDNRFDPYHNDFKNIDISALNLVFSQSEMSGNISKLSLSDSKDFRLSVAGKVVVKDSSMHIDDLSVITGRNNIQGNAALRYDSMQKLLSDPMQTKFATKVNAKALNLQEVTYFLPVLLRYKEIKPLYQQNMVAKLSARGTFNNIQLDAYDIKTRSNQLAGKGSIHIPENTDTWLSLDVSKAITGKSGLKEILAKGVLNKDILDKIPRLANLKGNLVITPNVLTTDLSMRSEIGKVRLKGTLRSFSDIDKIAYNVNLQTEKLLLGKLVDEPLMGALTLRGHFKGVGLSDLQHMKLETTGFSKLITIDSLRFEAISFRGSLANGILKANLISSNPDLDFDLSPTVYFNNDEQFLKLFGTVYHADLQKLNLTEDSLVVSAKVSGDLKKASIDSIAGLVSLSDIKTRVNTQNYEIDSVLLMGKYQDGLQFLSVKSPLADMDMSGKFEVAEIPSFLKNTSKYILFGQTFSDSIKVETLDVQGKVHIPQQTQSMIEVLDYVTPFQFDLHYNKSENSFGFQTEIDSLVVEKLTFDSLLVDVQTRREVGSDLFTAYSFAAKEASSKSVLLSQVSLKGNINNGLHDGLLAIGTPSDGYFRVPFLFYGQDKRPFLSIQDSLYLNGERWKVSQGNIIRTNLNDFAGSQLGLRKDQKTLIFQADDSNPDGLPYHIKVSSFDLESVFSLMKSDTSFLAGTANGTFEIQQLSPFGLTANVDIDDLKVKGLAVGDLTTEIKSVTSEDYAIKAALNAGVGGLSAVGKYNISEKAGNATLNFNAMSISPLTGFLSNSLDSLNGSLSGKLQVSIDSLNTDINGLLNIDSTSFVIRQTGAQLHITKGGLNFSGNKVLIPEIQITDIRSGHGSVAGSIDISNFKNPGYQIKLEATNLEAFGNLRGRGQLVSGEGKTNAKMELKGDLKEYRLTGQLALDENANITYKNAYVFSDDLSDGLLQFRDPQLERRFKTQVGKAEDNDGVHGLINTNLSVPSGATLTLILDEYTGEKVVVHGKSNLNYSRHQGGETQLNGKYEVSSGTYTFSVGNNIRKEFSIDNGSTIQWQGDPNEPISDLTATYKVTTSAGMLLQGMSADPEAGKRKFEFLVKLKVKGSIKKPEISFELGMNEKDQDAFNGIVYSKIKEINSEPSEVSKEVMSLLVLNSFMGDSPFGSLNQLTNTSLEIGAYNTIGNVLTSELNNMLAGMVKAVDITVGVNWSESAEAGRSSARSDIKLGLGKSLLHHRLNLYVGNNFGIETLSGANSGLSGLANDVSVEYLLNAEGKYRIKGYHVRDNELTLHGEHMETGVKFIIVWDFDSQQVFSGKRIHKKTAQ